MVESSGVQQKSLLTVDMYPGTGENVLIPLNATRKKVLLMIYNRQKIFSVLIIKMCKKLRCQDSKCIIGAWLSWSSWSAWNNCIGQGWMECGKPGNRSQPRKRIPYFRKIGFYIPNPHISNKHLSPLQYNDVKHLFTGIHRQPFEETQEKTEKCTITEYPACPARTG